ncbi:MAG: IclR family transcriptional regulator [Thermoleophilia bacterium]
MTRNQEAPRTGTQSIDRAARLLVRVVEGERPLTVSELAEAEALPRSTTSRLVGALERHGLVQRDGGVAVRPGPVLLRYAQRGLAAVDLVELAAETLDRLAEASGETVNLGVTTPLGVDQLDQRDSRHFIGSTNWVGRRVPHHCTALGKVFLAFGAARLPRGPLDKLAPRTIVDREELARELERVRARGYATTVDELEPGLWAVAAPVFGASGVVAALSISGPTTRLGDGLLDELGRLLVREAHELSARLGTSYTEEGAA